MQEKIKFIKYKKEYAQKYFPMLGIDNNMFSYFHLTQYLIKELHSLAAIKSRARLLGSS